MDSKPKNEREEKNLGFFHAYLSLWVALCILVGVLLGKFVPVVPALLARFTYYQVSLPIAALIWLMIYHYTLP